MEKDSKLFGSLNKIRQEIVVNNVHYKEMLPIFVNALLEWFDITRRYMPWRHTENAYEIYLSEIMLQQTQVARVLNFYPQFLESFSSFESISKASLHEVLAAWQGLGYNRRALNLHKAAVLIVNEYDGRLPKEKEKLLALPGIGNGTAGSLRAFVFNEPSVFIETNIRALFSFVFFPHATCIDDKQLLPLIEHAVQKEARQWYYALMDAGNLIKSKFNYANSNSKHYRKQSAFQGSKRQLRATIISHILKKECMHLTELQKLIDTKYSVETIVEELVCEGFLVAEKDGLYRIF